MAMRMFRSMRNPSTKTGATSNTTGSRIRSSARTIREGTVSLVQKARAKVGGAGYAHGTSSNKGMKGSAGQIKQTAANQSRKAGDSLKQTRRNTVSALKSAPAPQGSGLRYKMGYKMGTGQAAKSYKANVAANNPGKRTGLESRTLTQATAAIIQGKRAALRGSMAVDKGKTFATGVRMGSRMPDASMRQVYSAQRYADPKGIDKSVTRVSHATALTTAAGYGVGKAARKTVQGVNAIQDAPGRAAKSLASTSRKVAGGLIDAARNNRLSLHAQNAMHNIVRPGVKNAVEKFNSGAEKVFMGIGKGVGYAAAAPSLAVYHGGKALISGIRNNMAASARMKAASAAAMKSPRMTRAAAIGQVGRVTPMGRNSVVQSVRIQNVQNGGVYMGKKPQSSPSWNLSSNGTVSGNYGQPHPLRKNAPAPSIQTKSVSTTPNPNVRQGNMFQVPRTNVTPAPSRLQKTAPWQSAARGSMTKRVAGSPRRFRVASPTVPMPPPVNVEKEGLVYGNSQTGSRSATVTKEKVSFRGFPTTAMNERVSEVVGKARAARAGRPATAGVTNFKGPERMKGEKGGLARAGARRAVEKKDAFNNRFTLAPATSNKRGRPRKNPVGK